jgi:transcriptional regulator with XRE-family HTH domain
MNLKGQIHRELGEGVTEQELAAAVRVSPGTLMKILAGKDPQDLAVWEQFAKYFRMGVDFLRTGESAHAHTMVELPGGTEKPEV